MTSGGSRLAILHAARPPFVKPAPCLDSPHKSLQLRFDAVICVGVLVRHAVGGEDGRTEHNAPSNMTPIPLSIDCSYGVSGDEACKYEMSSKVKCLPFLL